MVVPKEGEAEWADDLRRDGDHIVYLSRRSRRERRVAVSSLDGVIPEVRKGRDYDVEYVEKVIERIQRVSAKHPEELKRLSPMLAAWRSLRDRRGGGLASEIDRALREFEAGPKGHAAYRRCSLALGMIKYRDTSGHHTERVNVARETVEKEFIRVNLPVLDTLSRKTSHTAEEISRLRSLASSLEPLVRDPVQRRRIRVVLATLKPAGAGSPPAKADTPQAAAAFARLMVEVADLVLVQQFEEASARLSGFREGGVTLKALGTLEDFERGIRELTGLRGKMGSSLGSAVGRTVTVTARPVAYRARITGVDGQVLIGVRTEAGGGKAVETRCRFALDEMSARDRYELLDTDGSTASTIMRGLLAYEAGSVGRAVQLFKMAGTALASALSSRPREVSAERSYVQMLRDLGIDGRLPQGDLAPLLRERRFSPSQVRACARNVAMYQREYGESRWAGAHGRVLKILGSLVPNIPLHVDAAKIRKVTGELQKANPERALVCSAKIKDDGLWLDLGANLELRDISALAGLPIRKLNLTQTAVTDLGPLGGCPVEDLDLSDTRGVDLSGISGCPLRRLVLAHSDADDVSALRGVALVHLDLRRTGVKNLRPIKKMPLETLLLGGTRPSDLLALRGMGLRTLDLSDTQTADISALTGMPLGTLDLSRNREITDIRALAGMPLRDLDLRNTAVTGVGTLADMPLEKLVLVGTRVADVSALRNTPLVELDLQACPIEDIEPLGEIDTLKILRLNGVTPPVRDLFCLRLLKLEELGIARSAVRSLRPLYGMPLKRLDHAGAPLAEGELAAFRQQLKEPR